MLIGLYGYHIHYLTFVNFDYGYNMTVNVAVGKLMVCNDSLWKLCDYSIICTPCGDQGQAYGPRRENNPNAHSCMS